MSESTPATLRLYGIPNCDTVKKSRQTLESLGWRIDFHDYRKAGVPPDRLSAWIATLGWATLLNRQGTTWRKADPAVQAGVVDAASAAAFLTEHASAIRRPLIEWPDGKITVGHEPAIWPAPHFDAPK